jgi:hypothetical protein
MSKYLHPRKPDVKTQSRRRSHPGTYRDPCVGLDLPGVFVRQATKLRQRPIVANDLVDQEAAENTAALGVPDFRDGLFRLAAVEREAVPRERSPRREDLRHLTCRHKGRPSLDDLCDRAPLAQPQIRQMVIRYLSGCSAMKKGKRKPRGVALAATSMQIMHMASRSLLNRQ